MVALAHSIEERIQSTGDLPIRFQHREIKPNFEVQKNLKFGELVKL